MIRQVKWTMEHTQSTAGLQQSMEILSLTGRQVSEALPKEEWANTVKTIYHNTLPGRYRVLLSSCCTAPFQLVSLTCQKYLFLSVNINTVLLPHERKSFFQGVGVFQGSLSHPTSLPWLSNFYKALPSRVQKWWYICMTRKDTLGLIDSFPCLSPLVLTGLCSLGTDNCQESCTAFLFAPLLGSNDGKPVWGAKLGYETN